MHLGQLFFGAACQLAGVFFVKRQLMFALSLWIGVAFSMAGVLHMARTLDRALPLGEAAAKIISRGYLFRYAVLLFVMAVTALTGSLNPLVVFLGYMSMKVTAYMQPFTHKVLNRLFRETDPVPEPLPEDAPGEGQALSGGDSQG